MAGQSPIDITGAVIDIGLSRLDLQLTAAPTRLINDGYTLQQEMEEGSGTLRWGGSDYSLLQFHFHTSAEHTVYGVRSPMELHAVFRQANMDPSP